MATVTLRSIVNVPFISERSKRSLLLDATGGTCCSSAIGGALDAGEAERLGPSVQGTG